MRRSYYECRCQILNIVSLCVDVVNTHIRVVYRLTSRQCFSRSFYHRMPAQLSCHLSEAKIGVENTHTHSQQTIDAVENIRIIMRKTKATTQE